MAGTFVKARFAGLARLLHSGTMTELLALRQEKDSASRRREQVVAMRLLASHLPASLP